MELFKTCVSVCTPAMLRESFALSGVEKTCFGAVNRLFASLMSQGVRLLAGVREPQGVLRGAGSAGEGPGQETGAEFRSWQNTWYPDVHGCPTAPEEDVAWYPGVHGCPTALEEERPQPHTTCSLLPWPCALLRPGARQSLTGEGEQPVLMSTEASCAAMLCQEEEWVPPPPPIHLAAGAGVPPSQAALERFH